MTGYRLPNRGRVDHARPVSFSFDGKSYTGLAGDTLASALLANGVHLMGRSFKYHRPRGVVSAGSDEPNALIGTRRGSTFAQCARWALSSNAWCGGPVVIEPAPVRWEP